jgi:hypothetical protein
MEIGHDLEVWVEERDEVDQNEIESVGMVAVMV